MLAPLIAALALLAQPSAAPSSIDDWQISGKVGPYPVGLDLLVENGEVESGRYFYRSQLKDIALQPHGGGPAPVTLTGADGSTFRLHFTGKPGDAATSFSTATGLAGSWTLGARTLPVVLSLESMSGDAKPGHRYAMITDQPDSVVEGHARQFLQAVGRGDRQAAAGAVSYPLRVNTGPGRGYLIHTRAAFLQRYDALFTPAYLAKLKTAVPHDMFVRDQGAMAADGAVWFDDKGASILNLGQ